MNGASVLESFRIYRSLGGQMDFETYKERMVQILLGLFARESQPIGLDLATGEGLVIGVASGVVIVREQNGSIDSAAG